MERKREEKSERTIKKDLRMQMYGKRRGQKEEERERKSRVEGRQGINEPENKEGASEREWKERRGRGMPDARDGDAGEEGTRERNVGGVGERGPRAERRGRESDGKNQ